MAESNERKRVAVAVDMTVWKEAKLQALRDDMDVQDLLDRALREYLLRRKK